MRFLCTLRKNFHSLQDDIALTENVWPGPVVLKWGKFCLLQDIRQGLEMFLLSQFVFKVNDI